MTNQLPRNQGETVADYQFRVIMAMYEKPNKQEKGNIDNA